MKVSVRCTSYCLPGTFLSVLVSSHTFEPSGCVVVATAAGTVLPWVAAFILQTSYSSFAPIIVFTSYLRPLQSVSSALAAFATGFHVHTPSPFAEVKMPLVEAIVLPFLSKALSVNIDFVMFFTDEG